MKVYIFTLCFLLFALLSSAQSEDIIILGNDYKIPKIYAEAGVAKGILVDIVRYIDEQLDDYSLTVRLAPWVRTYKEALHGQGGVIGLSITNERLEIFDYSDVIYHDEVILVVLKEDAFSFNGLQDLKGKRVGIGTGGSFGNDFERARKSIITVIEDRGPVVRLKRLLTKQIDCALISPGQYALNRTIEQDPLLRANKDKFFVLSQPFRRDPNYLGFSKTMDKKAFLLEFNKVLKKAYQSGELQRIIQQYN